MKSGLPIKLTKAEMEEFGAVFGPAPVLSSENEAAYEEIWENLIGSFAPRDFLELLLVRQVQDETWKIIRYTRHQMLSVDRRFRQDLELKIESQKEQAKRRHALANMLAEKTGRPATELSILLTLNNVVVSTVDEVDAILDRKPTEMEQNRALEAGIVFQEQLERLINSCFKRRNETIQQLEIYRAGLGQQWKEISDQIIDAEVTEVEERWQLGATSPGQQDPSQEVVDTPLAPDGEATVATTTTEQ